MNPRDIVPADLEYWAELDPKAARFTGPGEVAEGIEPCPAVMLSSGEVAVPWTLNEIELVQLTKGGTLWLVTQGGLPIHGLHVGGAQ